MRYWRDGCFGQASGGGPQKVMALELRPGWPVRGRQLAQDSLPAEVCSREGEADCDWWEG